MSKLLRKSNFLQKTIAVTTSVTTILSLSGVALFAPAFVFAATIVDGDTVTTADSFDIYIVKHIGDKKFKRLILNPEVFESYGHLTWDGVKTVTQAEQDEYTTSELVRAVDDKKVYKLTSEPNSDTGVKSWVNMTAAEFVAEGYDWDSIYEINATDRDNYTAGTDTVPAGTTPAPTGAGVTVALASDSPGSASVAMGSQNVIFAKVNFTGGENTTVSAISVRRAGIANDADLSDVKLWDGSTQLGATQAINTTTHKAVFTGLSWVVPSGMTKVLTITGSIAGTGTAATGTSPQLGIQAASDVVATTAVSGTFPAYGSVKTIAGLAVGQLNVDVRSVPGNNSPISGSTDQEISSWTFAASTAEGMSVSKIKLTQVGTASNTDLANINLKINGAQVGSTVSALGTDGTATFDFASSPIVLDAGTSKIIYVHADIAAGITTARTANFEITNAADVTALGANSGGSVTITYSSGTTFVAQTGTNAQTISQGTALAITVNGATNPSIQTFIRGATQELISAFRFSAGAGEDQRVSRLKLSLGGTGADATDISNVTLYKYDQDTGVETQVGTPTSFVGTVATYGADAIGLDTGIFDVAESTNVIIHVRADISAAASWTALGIFINEARLDGIKSQGNIGAATDDNADALGNVSSHLTATVGTITMSASPSSPAAQNVVPGTTGYVFGKFDFTMVNEAAILSSVTVDLCEGAACTDEAGNTTAPANASTFTNVKLWNGATQLGTTAATPSTSQSFSFNLTLPKNETVTLTVTGDVPTTAASTPDWTSSIAAVGIDRDITATGIASAATVVDPTADALGNAMTAVAETVTVLFQNAPASTVIVNQAQAVLSRAVLTAGAVGDVRVSSMQFTADDVTALNSDSPANTDFGTLQLYDVTGGLNTQLGSTASAFTTSSSGDNHTFTGLSLLIPKGTSKVVELRANILGNNMTGNVVFAGFADLTGSSSDVVATGLSSNTTIYGSGTDADDSGSITVASAGTLNVSVDAATPVAAFVAVGTAGKTGVDFAKWKFTANTEPVEISRLKVTLAQESDTGTDNEIPNFSALHLYNGTTKMGSSAYPAGTNVAATTTFTFVFDSTNDEFVVPKDGSTVLTLKADLNGASNGANSTTTPNFFIADVAGSSDLSLAHVDARGVSSGSRVTVSAVAPDPSTLSGTEPSNTNAMTVVRSKPVFALCTTSNCTKASPSGSLLPGTVEVIRFRITADADDVVFDSNSNIRFTIAQSGGTATLRAANLYEVGKTTAVATALSYDLTTSSGVLDFSAALDTTISGGTYKEYYVEVDLTDYATTGESFRLSIASAAPDVSYDDQVTKDITNSPTLDGLPMTGSTLVR